MRQLTCAERSLKYGSQRLHAVSFIGDPQTVKIVLIHSRLRSTRGPEVDAQRAKWLHTLEAVSDSWVFRSIMPQNVRVLAAQTVPISFSHLIRGRLGA